MHHVFEKSLKNEDERLVVYFIKSQSQGENNGWQNKKNGNEKRQKTVKDEGGRCSGGKVNELTECQRPEDFI
ncbi:MAG: hypothetical protein Q7S15_02265, partial [bacterium]|nr:hypothetical protein [bacterium]